MTQLISVRMSLSKQEIQLNLEIIKFLLEHGADRTLKSVDNKTTFDLANDHQCPEKILELLNTVQQKFFYDKRRKPRIYEQEQYLKDIDQEIE